MYGIFLDDLIQGTHKLNCSGLLLTVFISLIAHGVAMGDVVKVAASQSYEPFYVKDGGIEIDIVKAVFSEMGNEVEISNFPLERLPVTIANHAMDAALSALEKPGDGYFYSDEYIYYANVVVCQKDLGIDGADLNNLVGKRFGAWPGAHWVLGEKFGKLFKPGENFYTEPNSLRSLSSMFWVGRLDCIAIDKFIFLAQKASVLAEIGKKEFPVEFFTPFPKRTYFKVRFKDQNLRDKFNVALNKLKKSGVITEIYRMYAVNPSKEDLLWVPTN